MRVLLDPTSSSKPNIFESETMLSLARLSPSQSSMSETITSKERLLESFACLSVDSYLSAVKPEKFSKLTRFFGVLLAVRTLGASVALLFFSQT